METKLAIINDKIKEQRVQKEIQKEMQETKLDVHTPPVLAAPVAISADSSSDFIGKI